MALIDVVKCEMQDNELCKKFPSDDLRLGTQLVVYPSQVAIFVKGGQILDQFEAGTFTLKTSNIPLLNKIINLPFGSNSPFKADVWFINLTTKLDMRWGTASPIQLEDPKYGIIVPVRAYGQYGIKVINPEKFLSMLIGNVRFFSAEKIDDYFKGQLLLNLSNAISSKIVEDGVSILDVNTRLIEMSEYCGQEIDLFFEKYGLQLSEFSIASINIPQNDASVIRLKEAKDIAARMKITGRDVYQMDRSFDVLERAASNEGAGGGMAMIGAGLGVGVGIGNSFGNVANQAMNANITPPPIQYSQNYYVFLNGQQIGNQTYQSISMMISQGYINQDTLIWKQGLPSWVKITDIPELASLFYQTLPPPIK